MAIGGGGGEFIRPFPRKIHSRCTQGVLLAGQIVRLTHCPVGPGPEIVEGPRPPGVIVTAWVGLPSAEPERSVEVDVPLGDNGDFRGFEIGRQRYEFHAVDEQHRIGEGVGVIFTRIRDDFIASPRLQPECVRVIAHLAQIQYAVG